ncbi:putative chaperone protein [Pseudochelatococcus lubricantis]|uniref:Chaperone protein n=1 Tax=Pseudochelatococcus lubricantis TaxID=1538102 RepID=A0ABX0UVV5_9HYPH|nr:Hsp70 family protein [Pseudochelatococcus lubricantis]NIJ57091.1 putative chaperone protein [Pseudochelatococcus lubricantis]
MQHNSGQDRPFGPRSACGLDFGTSNSTLGIHGSSGPHLVALEGAHVAVPSAVFFAAEAGAKLLIGREAVAAYIEGIDGRLMRSLKSILGSALIDERTAVYRRRIRFSEVIGLFLEALKRRAEVAQDAPLDAVVMGRPVHFVDDDEAGDRHAEETLRTVAEAIGFREVSFQYEPVAAALDFERRHVSGEKIAIVADIGGGTSDFTVVRLTGGTGERDERGSDILANGGARLGGTDFDRQLSMRTFMPGFGYRSPMKRGDIEVPSAPYWDLSTWSSVHQLYDPKRLAELREVRFDAREPALIDRLMRVVETRRGHSVLIAVEEAKIALSDRERVETPLSWVAPGFGVEATRVDFEDSARALCDRLGNTARACVAQAGLTSGDVDFVFFTGGTSQMPSVRTAILSQFDNAAAIDGDRFGAVGLGLTIEARRRYG